MTDVELTRAVERCEIAAADFRHAAHLHVAWTYLSESGSIDEAFARMARTLRRFASAAGAPEKYHETITRFWVHTLANAAASNQDVALEEIVSADPRLLEKDFPLLYYSRERLFSAAARTTWLEPDLKPLLSNATATDSPRPSRDTPDRTLR